ncbi:hypothetical protein Pmani_035462 [Petrolisthes manimaculis]|uniref:Uncharacterized protein n=1 Tax=Petrolisthes manimaculis TaxID=1843537 RepID=A0AAE1TQH9_9EUCA|nr:hypothetical protein Pmani_035462 [Petrolisthes manimaculis]
MAIKRRSEAGILRRRKYKIDRRRMKKQSKQQLPTVREEQDTSTSTSCSCTSQQNQDTSTSPPVTRSQQNQDTSTSSPVTRSQQNQDTSTSPSSTSQQDQDVPVASTSSSSNTTNDSTSRPTFRHVTYIDFSRPPNESRIHVHVERTDIVFERVIRLPDAYFYVVALNKKCPCRVKKTF